MRVDTRAGSRDLIAPLRRAGVTVEECTLPAGDVEILGSGPEGRTVLVGIEYKTVEDAVACMRSGRFAEQLRGMRDSFEVRWLLVEGRIGIGRNLSVRRSDRWFEIPGKVTYQEFAAWLCSMAQCGGALLYRTETQEESVAWLKTLNQWWTAKDWEEHRAHLALYVPPLEVNPFDPPSLAERVAALLPHLGGTKARRAAAQFGSVKRLINADAKALQAVKGVGKKVAEDLVKAIEEGA